MRFKNDQSGYTIVELITGIVLIGVVTLIASNFFLSMSTLQTRTLNNEYALRAATRQLETLRNNNYNALVNGQDIDFTSDLPASLPERNGVVKVSEPTPGLKKVEVLVSYSDYGSDKTIKLVTLIGQIGLSQ